MNSLHQYTKWLLASLCTTAILFFLGCDGRNIGKEVLPPGDLISIKYTDTVGVVFNTHKLDSVPTYGTDLHIFGNYIDPVFGRISASTYAQFRIPGTQLKFGSPDSLRLDSVVLTIGIAGYFGRFETPQQLVIHAITQNWDTISYASDDTLKVDRSIDLGKGYVYNKTGSGSLRNMRIKLDNSIGEKILFAPTDSLVDNATFLKYFKGLYISSKDIQNFTSREPGATYYASLQSADTKLTLYYSKKSATTGLFSTQATYSLIVTGASKQFHNIKRTDYESRLLGQELNAQPRPHVYEFIQSGALILNTVKFPSLKNLGRIGINKAELILKVDPAYLGAKIGTTYRYLPPSIDVYTPDSTGLKPNTIVVFNVIPYDATLGGYAIPLTNYVQRVLNGDEENNGLLIRPTKENGFISNTPNRTVFGGVNNPTYKPVLRIFYSTLP